jgi:hypothetical protein
MIRLILILVIIGVAGSYLIRYFERRHRDRLSLLRSTFLTALPDPREHAPLAKDVWVRSGVLRFRVPRDWAEEYPDEDSASFFDRGVHGGVLGVKTSTISVSGASLGFALRAR